MRRAALAVCLAVVAALWVGAWLAWLAALGLLPAPSYAALAAFAATAALLGWGLAAARVPTGIGQLLHIGLAVLLGLALLAVTLRPGGGVGGAPALAALGRELLAGSTAGWLVLLAAMGLWWYGLRAGTARQTHAAVWRATRVAVIAFALLALVTQLSRPQDLALPLVGGTLLLLAALALAQMADLSEDQYTASSGVGGYGLALALLAMALVGGLGLLLSALVSVAQARAVLAPLAPPARWLRDGLVWLLYALSTAFFVVGLALRRIVQWFFGLFGGPVEPPQVQPPLPQPPLADLAQGAESPLYAWMMGGVLLLLLLLLVGWLARAYRRYNDPRLGPGGVERSSALGLRRVWRDAVGLAQAWWASAGDAAGRWGERPRGVRALYVELLAAGAERGHPRAAPATPFEYEPEAGAALPGAEPEVAEITAAYVAARYGDAPPGGEALARLRQRWRQVQATERGGNRPTGR